MIRTATDFCMYLLHEVHVSLVTGEAFGAVAGHRRDHVGVEIHGANAVVEHVGDVEAPVGPEHDIERPVE